MSEAFEVGYVIADVAAEFNDCKQAVGGELLECSLAYGEGGGGIGDGDEFHSSGCFHTRRIAHYLTCSQQFSLALGEFVV